MRSFTGTLAATSTYEQGAWSVHQGAWHLGVSCQGSCSVCMCHVGAKREVGSTQVNLRIRPLGFQHSGKVQIVRMRARSATKKHSVPGPWPCWRQSRFAILGPGSEFGHESARHWRRQAGQAEHRTHKPLAPSTTQTAKPNCLDPAELKRP